MSSASEIRHWYGFWLSLLTAFMWGVLPLALEALLDSLDVVTITWVRFAFSAIFVWALLRRNHALPVISSFPIATRWLLILAILGLVGNFLLYLTGLNLLNPESAQVLIQLAPFMLMIGSIFVYGEKMSPAEVVGALVLLLGLGLFFNDRLGTFKNLRSGYALGMFSMLAAALSWSFYGLCQKALLKNMSSGQLTLLIYAGGTVALLFLSHPLALFSLNAVQLLVLLFCCLNMVVGYGAFTEAIKVWHAAKVGAVIALAPVITIICIEVADILWPKVFASTQLNTLSYIGAIVVVAGSMFASLAKLKR